MVKRHNNNFYNMECDLTECKLNESELELLKTHDTVDPCDSCHQMVGSFRICHRICSARSKYNEEIKPFLVSDDLEKVATAVAEIHNLRDYIRRLRELEASSIAELPKEVQEIL